MAISARAISFLCLLFYYELTSVEAQLYTHTVYVDNSNENANDTAQCGSNDHPPCLSLSFALKNRTLNSTQFVIESGGKYTLNQSIIIANYNSIALTSKSNAQQTVTVSCTQGAGLSFINCFNIKLQGLMILYCSALQVSTSHNTSKVPFMKFPVSLYFLLCQNISLTNVIISSSSGTGIAVYATGGYNYFNECIFTMNGTPDDNTFPSGGGLYIEFPFFSPPANESVPNAFFTNAVYEITHSHFEQNVAHMWHPINYMYLLPQVTNHLSFGKGGGLSIFFNRANSCNVTVTECLFESNTAEWGGGLFVDFQEMSWNNSLQINSCIFQNNTAITKDISGSKVRGGGAMKIGYSFLEQSQMGHNKMRFNNCIFQSNTAFWGGGILFTAARERRVESTNTIEFYNCLWTKNLGRVGSAMDMALWSPVKPGTSVTAKFIDCRFTLNNDIYNILSPVGEPISIGVLNSQSIPIQFENSVHFESNNHSALSVIDAPIDFMENCSANFTMNVARKGGAVSLFGLAFIRVHKNTNMTFIRNNATEFGGAIYYNALGQHELSLFGYCFIQFSDIMLEPWNWTSNFSFVENTAGFKDGGDSIFSTFLLPCIWSYNTAKYSRNKVFCWDKNYWHYHNSQCEREVSSAPANFNLNQSKYHMEMILGKRYRMPIMMLGDKEKNQTEITIFNLWSHSDNAHIPTAYKYVSDNTISIHGRPNSSALLAVETIAPRVLYSEILVDILPCPPGFKTESETENDTRCVCDAQFGSVVQCDEDDFEAKLQRGLWMGEDTDTHEIVVGVYPYMNLATNDMYISLPENFSSLNKLLCGHANRKGVFCGECEKGYAPAIDLLSPSCMKCTHEEAQYNWVFYVLSEVLPVTIFFFVIMFFHISVTRGAGNSFVFFAQVLTTTFEIDGDGTIPLQTITSISNQLKLAYHVLYNAWNLNFFITVLPNFCLSPKMNSLTVLSLHYVLAVYSLVFIFVFYGTVKLYESGIQPFYFLGKPVHRFLRFFSNRWNLNRSIIDAFSTFLVLSYTKFTVVSVYLLTPTTLINSYGTRFGRGLYFQGNIEYLSSEHAPYFTVALLVMVVFVLLPPLLLLVYPLELVKTLAAKLGCCGDDRCFKTNSRLQLLLDTFQGCFKDGTNGTRDCRYFAGLYFILRTVLFTTYAYTGIWFQQYVVQQLVCTVAILLFAIIRPYKKDFYNNLDAVMLGILAMINALSMYNMYYASQGLPLPTWGFAIQYILIYIPIVYIIFYITRKLLKRKKSFLIRRVRQCLGDRFAERTGLLTNVLEESTEVSIDDEYRQFADEVEAYGRDRERNYYKPRKTYASISSEVNTNTLDDTASASAQVVTGSDVINGISSE